MADHRNSETEIFPIDRGAQVIDVRGFGGIPNDVTVNNVTAIRAAMAKAVELGVSRIYLCAGLWHMNFTAADSRIDVSSYSYKFIGDGRGITRLDVYNNETKTVTDEHWVFETTTPNIPCEARWMTVLGATARAAAHIDLPSYPHSGFFHQIFLGDMGTLEGNRYIFEGVHIDAPEWRYGIYGQNGPGWWEVTGCDIRVKEVCVVGFESSDTTFEKYLTLERNVLTATGVAADHSGGEGWGVGCYAHGHVNFFARFNHVRDASNVGIKWYSQGPNLTAKYGDFVGNTFENCHHTYNLPARPVTTKIIGGGSDGGAIAVGSDAVIQGFEFRGDSGLGVASGDRQVDVTVTLVGCRGVWNTPGVKISDSRAEPFPGDWRTVAVRAFDCEFVFEDGCDATTVGVSIGRTKESVVEGCMFDSRTTAVHPRAGLEVFADQAADTFALVRNNRWRGSFVQGWVGTAGVGKARFENNDYSRITAGNSFLVSASAPFPESFSGRENRLGENRPNAGGVGTGARFVLPSGFNPVEVPSAATVVLHPDYSVHKITGVTQINTIRIGWAGVEFEHWYSTPVEIILESALILGTTGNIVSLSAAPRVAGSVVRLHYVPEDVKWYEVAGV